MRQKSLLLPLILLITSSSIALGLYLYVAFSRVAYPFAIEWVESNTFLHVARALEHKSIYIPPSYDFIPMIYTPFYYYVVAVFARTTSSIIFSMRLVSILASTLIFVMLYALCRIRNVSRPLSFVAVGLFAASYGITGFWFDVGRVDTLFLALLLTAYVLTIIESKHDNIAGAASGFVIFLSFATKQSAVIAVPFLLCYLLWERRWKKAIWTGSVFAVSYGLFVTTMDAVSNGWFWIYVYRIPSAHPVSWTIVTKNFWTLYIFPHYSWLLVIIVLWLGILFAKYNQRAFFKNIIFAIIFFLSLAIISVSAMAKQYGYVNSLLPIVAALSVIGVESYQQIVSAMRRSSTGTLARNVMHYLVSAFMLLQFVQLRYDFRTQIPSTASLNAGYRILDLLKRAEKPVFIPTAPYLLYLVDQPTHFQSSSLGDLQLAAQLDPAVNQVSAEHINTVNKYPASASIMTAILPDAQWYADVFNNGNGYICEDLAANHPPLITVTGAISYLDDYCTRNRN